MKKILILGSTGSIGTQALDIVRQYPDRFQVVGLAISSNTSLLDKQIVEFKPKYVSVEHKKYENANCNVLDNALELVTNVEADIIILAMVGISGLKVAYEAVSKGVRVALANKETLVACGEIIMNRAKECGTELLPLDSEHSAIWQCLNCSKANMKQLLLTASGGAFRDYTKKQLTNARAREALNHPVWNMGSKVTIDSATLMNKGLEIIEAMHLFGVSQEQIKVIIHTESIIHSMVEYKDNSVIAQMSNPDMRLPIQLALTYPNRIQSRVPQLNFAEISTLNFRNPDTERFPCLDIAINCANKGGIAPAIMNAANEKAVELYLQDIISFYDIPAMINKALDKYVTTNAVEIEDILRIDSIVKEYTLSLAKKMR